MPKRPPRQRERLVQPLNQTHKSEAGSQVLLRLLQHCFGDGENGNGELQRKRVWRLSGT